MPFAINDRVASTQAARQNCRFAARSLVAVAVGLLVLLAPANRAFALGQDQYIQDTKSDGGFGIVQDKSAATLFVDSSDFPGVIRAANDLQSDIHSVTGVSATVLQDAKSLKGDVIIAGTIGKSPVLDQLSAAGKIDISGIKGKWESFLIQVVPQPMPGVANALVIAGSDKRGTIYGIYDVSEQIGVSPWYWWSDVPAKHHDALFVKPGRYLQGEPSVKYRGIFLNDESPDLSNWVTEKFGAVPNMNGVANYNSKFYSHIFEVILRLKGNYLWPAMWNNAFNVDDPDNAKLADEYGIVMGTSHQEPMLRAQKEWDRQYSRTLGSWNYYKNPDVLQAFWREGIKRNKDYESILTIGLRGANDTPMIPGGTMQQSMDLLKQIIDVQRKMIADEINPDVTKVPQLWCPYKEVLDYFNAGFTIPDDVTILWTDDNWGNLRRLPTDAERKRPGGAGIYYHFDYVGGPRNYKWVNTNPIAKVYEQMSQAKARGADRIWIVNVGHFKGEEFPVGYFMDLAWNADRWTNQNINQYTKLWAAREFGPDHADDIAEIVEKYTKFNGRRKPEEIDPNTFSQTDYQEAENVVADFKAISDKAAAIHDTLPENQRDAFYELVEFPTLACEQVTEMYVAAGRNALYAKQGRASANDAAADVQRLFKADADLMAYYNHTLAGGKWDHFMDQVHIGYTMWQDPARNTMPRVQQLTIPPAAGLGVAVEGSASAWPGTTGPASLPKFDAFNRQRRYVDVFDKGRATYDFTATASDPWITLSASHGTIEKQTRLWVTVDWAKVPKGTATGSIRIDGADQSVAVAVNAFNPAEITRDTLDGFVEGDGCVSIEAEHFSKNSSGPVRWEKIEDYGRTLSGMSIMPNTAASVEKPAPGSPCMEFKMYLFDAGPVSVESIVGPSLNYVTGRGLRYAISFDDEPPRIMTVTPANFNAQNGNRPWETAVEANCWMVKSTHTVTAAGYHTLKFWMVDPGVVLEKLVVDLGGVKQSYLGPPESYSHTNPNSSHAK